MTGDTTWLNWSDRTSNPSDDPISADVLSVPGSGSLFFALLSTFPVPYFLLPRSLFTVPFHRCLILVLVTLHTQLRLTTSKAVSKLESKTCQVAEHNNRCKEGKIIIFLCRVEVLSCETHRYFVVALELKERKKNSLIIQTNSKQIKITTVGLFL